MRIVSDVVPPIVIYGDGDCDVSPTVALACQAVEATDVDDGLYEAFDSQGTALMLVTSRNQVFIELPANSVPEPAALERRLRDHIGTVGADSVGIADLRDASLPVLLDALGTLQQSARRSWSLRDLWSHIRPSHRDRRE